MLIVNDQLWWLHSLKSVCDSAGFTTRHATSFTSAAEQCRSGTIDAILVLAPQLDPGTLEGCRGLRSLAMVGLCTPILLVLETAPGRDQRLATLEAGYWECLTLPVDAEFLILKLRLLVAAKRQIDLA